MSRFNQIQNNRQNNRQNINSIIQTHLNNINILANSIQESHSLIERLQRQNYIENNNATSSITNSLFESILNNDYSNNDSNRRDSSRTTARNRRNRTTTINNTDNDDSERRGESLFGRQNNLNAPNYHVDNDNNVLYFTFDTLIPSSYSNSTNSQASDLSFQTLLITEENKEIINSEISGNTDLSSNTMNYNLFEIQNFNLIENPINDVCPITRERFDATSEHILMIKNCKHIFNKSALNIWLENNNTCPCCRRNIIVN